jgi:hypothetical protein
MEKCKKSKFGSEKFAKEHIARIKKKSTREKVPFSAYLCHNCGSWHLTSQPQRPGLIVKLNNTIKEQKTEIKNLNIKLNKIKKIVK